MVDQRVGDVLGGGVRHGLYRWSSVVVKRKEVFGDAALYLGDCADVLLHLVPFDVLITDPPYDERTARNFTGNRARASEFRVEKAGIAFGHLSSMEWLPIALGRCKRWAIVWCALEQLGMYQAAAPDHYVRGGFWDRTNGAPQFSGDRPAQPGEACAILHAPGKKRWNGGGRRAFWTGGRCVENGNAGIGHPTPKPRWLMEQQVNLFTEPSETVCDPFMGSGTTGIAALALGRKFIGIEIDPKYFQVACERIDAAQRQGRLLG